MFYVIKRKEIGCNPNLVLYVKAYKAKVSIRFTAQLEEPTLERLAFNSAFKMLRSINHRERTNALDSLPPSISSKAVWFIENNLKLQPKAICNDLKSININVKTIQDKTRTVNIIK